MAEIATTASAISEFGLYAIIAVLCGAVVYLFKRTTELSDKISQIHETNARTYADCTVNVTKALVENNVILRELKESLLK